jgi:LPS-assembly protein
MRAGSLAKGFLLGLWISLFIARGGLALTIEKGSLPRIDTDEGAPIHIEADSITYDRKLDQYIAEGNVEIVRAGMTLRAQKVILDNRTKLAIAEGKVEVLQQTTRIWSDRLELQMEEQTGRLLNATLYFEPYETTITGEEIEKLGEDHYRVKGATLSSCPGPNPDWRFAADEVEIKVSGDAVARGATFQVRKMPVFYLPYLVYPASRERRTGFLLPEYRSNSRIGYGFSLPFFWAIGDSYDATFTESYYTKRGFQQGVEFRYAPWESLKGTVQGEFIHDQEKIDSAIVSRGGPRKDTDRWRVGMEQEANLPLGMVSRAKVDLVSDNYYLEDLSPDNDERFLTYLPSIVNLTKRWDSYLLAGEVRYFRDLVAPKDDNDLTPQRLPSIMFHRMQTPLGRLPVDLGWASGFDHFWRPDGSKSEVMTLAPGASLPIPLGPFLKLIPYAGWKEEVFTSQDREPDGAWGHLSTYTYGVSLSTELFRSYPVGSSGSEIFKHTIQPEVGFQGTGRFSSGDFPWEFLDRTPSDKVVYVGLTQFLTRRMVKPDGSLSYREWARLRIVQPFSLREQFKDLDELDEERHPWRPFRAELDLRLLEEEEGRTESEIRKGIWAEPRQFLNLKFRNEYNWYEDEFNELSVTLHGADGRGDELALSYGWGKRLTGTGERVKFVQANAAIRTLPFLDLLGHAWYNQDEERFSRYGYGLLLHPSCWAIRFTHTIEPGFGGRVTDHSFRLQVYLLGLDRVAAF